MNLKHIFSTANSRHNVEPVPPSGGIVGVCPWDVSPDHSDACRIERKVTMDLSTFDAFKTYQRKLMAMLDMELSNSQVLRMLVHSAPLPDAQRVAAR